MADLRASEPPESPMSPGADDLSDMEGSFCSAESGEYSYEESDGDEGGGGTGGGAGGEYKTDYKRLTPAEVREEMGRRVKDVSGILSVPEAAAEILLCAHKWDKERLLEAYYSDPKATKAKVGVEQLCKVVTTEKGFDCRVCFDEVGPGDGASLGCMHEFCKECWGSYLDALVTTDGNSCIFATCMEEGCKEVVPLNLVRLFGAAATVKTWERFLAQSFVTINKSMAWCPGPGCGIAFESRGAVKRVTCDCGMEFCFRCSRETHRPVSCPDLSQWEEKCSNESETANWIIANTKNCPKCKVRIEKNQGCNHMTCTNRGCKYEFCWICLAPWAEHGASTGGYYKCNRYTPTKAGSTGGKESDPIAKAKMELDKYLFYFQRFSAHVEAGKFAEALKRQTASRMQKLQRKQASAWVDVEFLEAATDLLLECRRVLKYTYVHAFYMEAGPEKGLFEHAQEYLEKNTEHLHELSEMPIEEIVREDVVNYTRVTRKFLDKLLDGVEEGLLNT